jgi:hypothetical protein
MLVVALTQQRFAVPRGRNSDTAAAFLRIASIFRIKQHLLQINM